MMTRRRKLLSASLGVAAVSYVVGAACNESMNPTSANLMAPPPMDGSAGDGSKSNDAAIDQGTVTSGNLPAPPPPDAGDAGDASDDAADSD